MITEVGKEVLATVSRPMMGKRKSSVEPPHSSSLTGAPRYSGPRLGYKAVLLELLFDGERWSPLPYVPIIHTGS